MEQSLDREEVRLASKGDTAAFASLVRKYKNAVIASSFHLVGDFYQAQDIAQEAFVRAWHHLNDLKEGDKFGNWLYSITRRLSIDWLRKNKKLKMMSLEEISSYKDTMTVEDRIIALENQSEVWRAVNELEEPYRIATLMYYISGFTSNEISRFLGVSKNTIESRIRRARTKMKRELIQIVETTLNEHKVGQEFEQEVIHRVSEVACINLPVSNIEVSTKWYVDHLGSSILREPQRFSDGNANSLIRLGKTGPFLFLVKLKLRRERKQTKQLLIILNYICIKYGFCEYVYGVERQCAR
ncbi:RNA polymerase sigma factor [Paenibacillus contaminans]|nr:RNA polymerase sigma factor [Paenibacillus contaminans]